MPKPIVQIKNAKLVKHRFADTQTLQGNVLDHPRFKPDAYVYTSVVEKVTDDGKTVETLNTIYKLV